MATLRQFQYVVAVVEYGGFSAAADELGVSQPGLSHQVKALETELGGALLERLTSGPRLTPLGRAVLPHARGALAEADRVNEVAATVLGLGGGSLRVATITSLSLGPLPDLVRRWRSEHPGVSITLREHRTMVALLHDLDAGGADLAIAPTPPDWSGTVLPIGEEELVVVVSVDHRLVGRAAVAMGDLAAEPWVRFVPEHGLAGVLDHQARLAGFSPIEAMQTEQTAAGPLYAAAGVGACLVPANLLGADFRGHRLSLDPPLRRPVSAIARTLTDPLSAAFAELARRHLRLT